MDATTPVQMVADLGSSVGAVLSCTFIAVALTGVTCMQTFIYYINYADDPIHLKAMAVFVLVMDITHSALLCSGVWSYVIAHFGDFDNLHKIQVPLMFQTLFTSFVAVLVQGFFTHRIWKFSGRKWIFPAILVPPNIAQLALTLCYLVKGLQEKTDTDLLKEATIAYSITGIAAAADILIAAIMVALLAMGRTSGFSKPTDRMIVRLVAMTLNTGLWTAVVAFVVIITLVASPETHIYWGVYFILCPLYSNTLLATLNARVLLRQQVSTSTGSPIAHRMDRITPSPLPNFRICVETSTMKRTDTPTPGPFDEQMKVSPGGSSFDFRDTKV